MINTATYSATVDEIMQLLNPVARSAHDCDVTVHKGEIFFLSQVGTLDLASMHANGAKYCPDAAIAEIQGQRLCARHLVGGMESVRDNYLGAVIPVRLLTDSQ